jgi:LPS sulfotransferase NodH
MSEYQGYDAAWEAWFAAEGIVPLRLTYEALARDPIGGLQEVLTFLDLVSMPK